MTFHKMKTCWTKIQIIAWLHEKVSILLNCQHPWLLVLKVSYVYMSNIFHMRNNQIKCCNTCPWRIHVIYLMKVDGLVPILAIKTNICTIHNCVKWSMLIKPGLRTNRIEYFTNMLPWKPPYGRILRKSKIDRRGHSKYKLLSSEVQLDNFTVQKLMSETSLLGTF